VIAVLVRLSVERAGLTVCCAALACAFFLAELMQADLDIFPEFSPRRVVLQSEAPGLATLEVEQRVSAVLEAGLAGLSGLRSLRSESLAGLSVVTAEFDPSIPVREVRQRVSERLVSRIGTLPPGVEARMMPLSSSSATVHTFGLTPRDGGLRQLRGWVDAVLVPRLLAVRGVADVNVFGGLEPALVVRPRWSALIDHDTPLAQVLDGAREAVTRWPLAAISTPAQQLGLWWHEPRNRASLLEQAPLLPRDGVARGLTLGYVAEVLPGHLPPVSAAQIGGDEGVVLMVIGAHGAATAGVEASVEAAIAGMAPLIETQGFTLHTPLFRPTDYIETAVRSITSHLGAGAAVVLLVLLLFLFDLRAAAIATAAIPLSLLGAAAALIGLGQTLNLMVIGGLAIALGEVVDDAIIDCENIQRRLRDNAAQPQQRPVAEVVRAASMEVRGSVIYATCIVALVFVPLLTLEGLAGRLFAPLGLAYILAIMGSLLVALTVTPAMCRLLLATRQHQPGSPLVSFLQAGYAAILRRVFRRPRLVLCLALFASLAALLPGLHLGGEFLPPLREGHFLVHTSALPGTSLTAKLEIGRALTRRFEEVPGVVSVSQWAGRAERGADTYGSHYSEYDVRLTPLDGAGQQTVADALREILEQTPGIDFELNTFLTERVEETVSGYAAPVVVHLYGSDLTALELRAAEVEQLMAGIGGATAVRRRALAPTPELVVQPVLEAMAAHGVSASTLQQTLAVATGGITVGSLPDDSGRVVPVLVQDDLLYPGEWSRLGRLPVAGSGGWSVLGSLAAIRQGEGRYNALRRDGRRVQTITCSVAGRDLEAFTAELRERLNALPPLAGVGDFEVAGSAVEQSAARQRLVMHALLAGAAVLMLASLALGSLRHVLVVTANLPFALAGGVLAAAFGGQAMSVGATVGFVTLFGITVRNAIMLVSHYRHLVDVEGVTWSADTAQRGAVERLPSILMTAAVTAFAMLPIALDSDNPGREIMGPMATIIIGGLVSSTALTLLTLPVLMHGFGRFRTVNRLPGGAA
jgi:CzcA family heavy metal efflux pump